MKRRIALVLLMLLVLTLNSEMSASAFSELSIVGEDINNTYDAVDVECKNVPEKKIKCTATLDDDFSDDSVIVVMTNEASLEFEKYNRLDFKTEHTAFVRELTSYTFDDMKEKFEYLKSVTNIEGKEFERSTLSTKDEIDTKTELSYRDEDTDSLSEMRTNNRVKLSRYHRIIKINLDTHNKQAVLDTVNELEKREDVLAAHPNYYQQITAVPNDPYYYNQWMPNSISLPSAWNITRGSSSVTVGVIDSGIKRVHSDLYNNVDSALSKSFVSSNNPFSYSDEHGTCVAGIIGAVGNNNDGISGVCWNIKLVSLKADTSVDAAINAIDYAEQKNIDILNYSYSASNTPALKYAIQNYSGLFVCSAGNDGRNIDDNSSYGYPSKYRLNNMISVAAIDDNNQLSVWNSSQASNYGANTVHIAAPGTDLYTTDIGNTFNSYYTFFSGTSSAAPVVSGVAALIKSKYPNISTYGVRAAILLNVDTLNSLTGKVKYNGKINAYKALSNVETRKFTVVYNKNGGSGNAMNNTTVIYGINKKLRANTYTKTGYTFSGWYAKRASDNKWFYEGSNGSGWYIEGNQPSGYHKHLYSNEATVAHTSITINDTVTMYAQWTPITYTIHFDANGGNTDSPMLDQMITYGIYSNLHINTYTKHGYNFSGWYARRQSDNKWYYTNGSDTGWYIEGLQPNGYNKCLYSDGVSVAKTSAVNGDIVTMYAQWTPITYTIHFDANGGNTNPSMPNQTISYGVYSHLHINTYTKHGYNFLGWYAHRQSDNKWYYTDGIDDGWYIEGLQPSGYYKWLYTDGVTVSKTSAVDGDIVTMYAQWIPITYTIHFDANGGSTDNPMSDQVITYGIYSPLYFNTYTKHGYNFSGWHAHRQSDNKWYYTNGNDDGWYIEGLQPSGYQKWLYTDGVTVAKTSAVDGDIVTMYAQWIPITYTIQFDANGGSTNNPMLDQIITYGIYSNLHINTYTNQGYSFSGWYAHRQSDNKWYYTDGVDTGWYIEGLQPSGYYKWLYADGVTVAKTSAVNGDIVTMYAQWI